MNIVDEIKSACAQALKALYGVDVPVKEIAVSLTKPEFEGDYTLVLFGFIKTLKKSPDVLGNEIGNYVVEHFTSLFSSFNIIKGFLNFSVTEQYWLSFLQKNNSENDYGIIKDKREKIMVEYSSPNTNKPLHLGHLRNNFLGWSTAETLKAAGNEVVKTCIVNDRGIHICKSMIAWKMFANGATPASASMKGDHFVGDYYVKFNDEYKLEINELISSGMENAQAEKEAPIMLAAQQMLLDWEAGKPDVIELWKMMNSWVYKGFDETYKTIGTDFDKIYYESEAYLLGKDMVDLGLKKHVFYQKEDGSVWINLTADGLDEKIVRRKDGTSVYITQDIGLIVNKFDEFHCSESIYVVGDEQNYHFKVLKLIAQKMELPSSDGLFHLSYGMVELPTGKMKSREGTVVDADDIVAEMIGIAKQKTEELGKVKDFNEQDLEELYKTIGLGALKFFLLRMDPKKRMIFNPEESIDFHGFTGPFVQYTHARIKSILRKLQSGDAPFVAQKIDTESLGLLALEKQLIIQLEQFASIIEEAATTHDPSKIAIYVFNLSKTFNSFYSEHSISNAENEEKKSLRFQLALLTSIVLKNGMKLLGINVPERM